MFLRIRAPSQRALTDLVGVSLFMAVLQYGLSIALLPYSAK